MIVRPKIRGNICITAHPAGCAAQVRDQIAYVRGRGEFRGPRGALVIGSSNGYGLAARITAAFGCSAATVGVAFEKPGTATRTATVGWYNDRAFLAEAAAAGISAWSLNGDAFARGTKDEAVSLIRREIGEIDLLVYSIASPRRVDPDSGEIYSTSIKPIGKPFSSKTLDFLTGRVTEVTEEPASDEEIAHTVKVMGGEDWSLWVEALDAAGVLARGFTTVAFSYMGPPFTAPIYRDGTIGKAKEHLELTAKLLDDRLAKKGGRALVSVNKALLTRASAVIPAVPLYVALLYRVMKAKGIHEGCIEQMDRLFRDRLYSSEPPALDAGGRVRLDELEMREDVQREVGALWKEVERGGFENVEEIEEFRREYLRHHGFAMEGVDYDADVEV